MMSFPAAGIDVMVQFYRWLNLKCFVLFCFVLFCFVLFCFFLVLGVLYDNEYKTKEDEN